MVIANIISYVLVIIGALNWGLGIWNVNLVTLVFPGPMNVGAIIVYSLIALSAIWLIISPIITNGMLKLQGNREAKKTSEA
ncbi:MAG: DUF378 domain-containing protein [Clostridia bacterium]|nr:DUF378 domain-containing protein [Clostridia bacterium]